MSDASSVAVPLRERWLACVRRSFSIQVAGNPDRNQAAELAFAACQSEENAIVAAFPSGPDYLPRTLKLVALVRARTKQELVGS